MNIFEIFRIGDRIVIGSGLSVGCIFVELERAGDSHLVDVSVCRKRFEAGMLILPSEAADAFSAIGGLQHRHKNDLASQSRVLTVPYRIKRTVRYRFDESVTEKI